LVNLPGLLKKNVSAQKNKFTVEYEAPDIVTFPTAFFSKLTDDSIQYLCDTFYTVTKEFQGENYSGHSEVFQDFIYEKQIAVGLEEAPWADRPDLGIYHIQSWLGKGLLELPEGSITCNQLRRVANSTVKHLPQTLNAVNALRFVVCGFEKYRPTPPPIGGRESDQGRGKRSKHQGKAKAGTFLWCGPGIQVGLPPRGLGG
jgi:hypothetical protein